MNPLRSPASSYYCPVEQKPCISWIQDWFKDCLCNLNDYASFALGIASLVCWAVAEIPQIITNFKNKSADGVSLAFLSTWIIGDVFNLVGCILEPATLPTQFYTAVLYTTVTIILALQCIYYDHFLGWWNRRTKYEANMFKDQESEHVEPKLGDGNKTTMNAPVEVPRRRDFYFTSARSLAGSGTPPAQSYIKARSGPPIFQHHSDSSSEEEEEKDDDENQSRLPLLSSKPPAPPRPIPRPVSYGAFAAASASLPNFSRALRKTSFTTTTGAEQLGIRRLLLGQESHENAFGQSLGWLMAAIYMGGRIPQIWLNIKRGSVEGLNPLMFVFALVANATYTGSILVRTTEWRVIKADMPWLLDAIVCVVLDLFIILQYIFYKYIKLNKSDHARGECYGDDYVEADKPTT